MNRKTLVIVIAAGIAIAVIVPIVTFSLIRTNNCGTVDTAAEENRWEFCEQAPRMVMFDDYSSNTGQITYLTNMNWYCGSSDNTDCDFTMLSRVAPIEVSTLTKGAIVQFLAEAQTQPTEIETIVHSYSPAAGEFIVDINQTKLTLVEVKEQVQTDDIAMPIYRYQVELAAGDYILDVLATWNTNDVYKTQSVHRFKVKIVD